MSTETTPESPKEGVPTPDSEGQESPNTTSVNRGHTDEITRTEIFSVLPSWFGKTPHLRVLTLYERMLEYKLGVKPAKITISSPGSIIVRNLVKRLGEATAALVIITHFDWKGLDGSDEGIAKRLANHGYPLVWVPANVTLYEAYIKNRLQITDEVKAVNVINKVLTKITHD